MLKIDNLSVNYGGIKAVRNVSFEVPDGKIVTLIGANGAGKSTILRTITGLVHAASGSITYDGEELTKLPTHTIVTKGITLVPEGRHVFPDMTVLENLKIGAYLRKDNLNDDIEWVYSLFPRLKERNWQQAGTLSGEILNIIKEINKRGVTILLIEQNANMALHIADLAYVLETGTIALHGTGQELLANEKVKELYLGKGK